MDKNQILLDSVKKLLSLNVPTKDIISNMIEVGLSEQEAKELIKEAGGSVEQKTAAKEVVKQIQKQPVAETFEPDLSQKVAKKLAEQEAEKYESAPTFEDLHASLRHSGGSDVTKLWEKGIMATVNSTLDEIRNVRDEIDSIMEEKIAAALKKESAKIDLMMQSQKTLILTKIDSELETKKNEITEIIDAKLDEIKKMNELTQQNLSRMEAQKKFNQELMNQIQKKMEETANVKDLLVQELEASMQEANSKIKEFVKGSSEKLDDSESRINKTLELEAKITEGMLKDANLKIDKIMKEKMKELDAKIAELKK